MNDKASRVLIVDDMPVNRMILSSLLASNGVACDLAESGRECLDLCRERDYDLILLDHRMPELDGVDTLVILKTIFEERGIKTPVICHTTEEGRKNIKLYKAAGFADVLIKPVDPTLLSVVLMTYLPEEDRLSIKEEEKLAIDPQKARKTTEDMLLEGDDELDRLPHWLKKAPHLDLVSGVEKCGSAQDYIDALYIFRSSIEDKTSRIRIALETRDYSTYTMLVHSLKSTAALIGANKLSEIARDLEKSSKKKEHSKLTVNTPAMLTIYKDLYNILSPLQDLAHAEDKPEKSSNQNTPPVLEQTESSSETVLFVQGNHGIVTTGIENTIRKAGLHFISVPDEPHLIISNRDNADMVLYMPGSVDKSHTTLVMNLLGDICQDDSKILCLTGNNWELDHAMTAAGAFRVTKSYLRPMDAELFAKDLKEYSRLEKEFHRKKSLYLVDDDPDYLEVIGRWLSSAYQVSCFNSPHEFLEGISAATCDLILMDYEMPEMDGYELLKKLRLDYKTCEIPIIFLTVKNDREHVSRILEYKPDGYLLKSSQKEAILDAIQRFFSESLFKISCSVNQGTVL